MAIQSTKRRIKNKGEVGKDAAFTIEFEIHMQAGDGVITALSSPDLPAKGDTYNHNGETHPAAHTIKRTEIIVATPSKVIAVVSCDYELKQTDPDGPDPNGDPTTDPLEIQARVVPGYRILSVPISKAKFVGYYDADGSPVTPADPTLNVNEESPIRNSVWVPFVPVPERPVGFPTLTVERYYRSWNHNFDNSISTLNDASYQIALIDGSGYTVYNRTFAAEKLFLANVTADPRQFGNKIYYWVSVELWIGDFYLDYADVGVTQLLISGGGAASGVEPIKNANGENVQEPVPLDGGGLAITNPTAADTIYLRWKPGNTSDFSALGPLL